MVYANQINCFISLVGSFNQSEWDYPRLSRQHLQTSS
jgi:hypothetical protein